MATAGLVGAMQRQPSFLRSCFTWAFGCGCLVWIGLAVLLAVVLSALHIP
jgi:hypothetical protein